MLHPEMRLVCQNESMQQFPNPLESKAKKLAIIRVAQANLKGYSDQAH